MNPLLLLSTVLTLLLHGCAVSERGPVPIKVDPRAKARLDREASMQAAWIGKSIFEVEASLGEPEMILQIPGTGTSSVMVYGVLDTGSYCIDAFRVAHGASPTVTNYFCR
ncbi:hypothetical protein [Motiliproteus sp. SC1-56]|uniref:hypothetical protein n=1 Tax=Motiliproteus sp. SC1-56 TaxID=2799565 RepID=UPI001A8F17F4|nr:hypothetical protein [Motiliproteus sp. SC1-56]